MKEDENRPNASDGTQPPGEERATRGIGVLLGVTATSAILGAAVGALVIGPRIAQANADRATSPAIHQETETHSELGEGKFFELENLVVNPAGSRGERFLMVSVAFEVPDDDTVNQLHEREVQVRDVVSATLESQTMETLTREGARDDLKRQLSEAVVQLAGDPEWIRVYIPRFVIQ